MRCRSKSRPFRGFTLIELLTVIGILAVLAALVVGAAHGVREHAAHEQTLQTLRGLEAALSRYFDDWNKFPWWTNSSGLPADIRHLMGKVSTDDDRDYAPLQNKSEGDPASACLHASLTMDELNGPYYPGAGANVRNFAIDVTGSPGYDQKEEYKAFVDGWGRPIHYFEPKTKKGTNEKAKFPLLMSEGPEKDMSDAESREDNIYNYEPRDAPNTSEYFQ